MNEVFSRCCSLLMSRINGCLRPRDTIKLNILMPNGLCVLNAETHSFLCITRSDVKCYFPHLMITGMSLFMP